MKVLVTGAGGMLAQATIPKLEEAGHDVLPLRRRDADVTRPGALLHPLETFAPDWIFHFAAFTRVDECETRPDHAYRVNEMGARNAALAAASVGAGLLAISTDYVFDGESRVPYREYDAARPCSVYGASKWAGEQAIRELHPRHLVVRTAWLFGRGGANFIDTILHKARAREPLAVVDDQRGAPTWTQDLADALLRLVATGQLGTYHVTSSGEASWHEVATYVLAHAGLDVAVARTDSARLARPARRPAFSVLNHQAYEHATGHRMPHWQDAVDRYLARVPVGDG